jgi:hypothetical protein
MSARMSLISRLIPGLILAVSLALSPVLAANAPPTSAPRDPVEISPLPPVRDSATPIAPAAGPVAAPPPSPASASEPAWWQQPTFWALIALVETIGAFIATILYMRRPEQNRLVLALAMTGGSAVFIVIAMIAWLW